MSAKTPGQAAYEAFQRAFPDEDWGPWDMLDGDGREGWEAAAQAAIDAAEADGRTVPLAKFGEVVADVQSLRAERDRARERITALETERDERWPRCPDGCGCRLGTEDADASECACEGPCCDECRENGYPDAPSYRDAAVKHALDGRDAVRERLEKLAASLELSAAKTEPSKKSDIERQTARRVRDIAGRPL